MEEPTNRRPTREEEEDLLSTLPNDVLISIIDKLHLRDAVRLAVLSRRWQCLANQLPRIHLDIDDFVPNDYDRDHDGCDHVLDYYQEEEEEDIVAPPAAITTTTTTADDGYRDILSEAGDRMADVVAALLASRRRTTAGDDNDEGDLIGAPAAAHTTLAMRFYLRHNYMTLGRMLDSAVAGGTVHAAELTITASSILNMYTKSECDRANLAFAVYGRRFSALFGACPTAFGALTQLNLQEMRFHTFDLCDILATCTRLEKLSLFRCRPPKQHKRLWQLQHAQLEDISISICGVYGVKLVCLPRLKRFAFLGWLWTTHKLISFGHVPCLTAVTLSHDMVGEDAALKLSHILANTAVNDLRLNFKGNDVWVQPESPRLLIDVFHNLKNLKICNVHQQCGLTWTMFLLQSAPHLQELYIKLMDHDCLEAATKKVPWEVSTSFKHHSLARVTILGFYSRDETITMAFIRRLVEAAVVLEKICIRGDTTASLCGSRFPRTDQDKDTFCKRITDGRSNTSFKIHIQSILN
ncbi:hypothetical protein BS78_07G014400 [Paspalum vaginatum]|nr:hypothetical protein BS78_07G014400 [Paspalum vaginatum]